MESEDCNKMQAIEFIVTNQIPYAYAHYYLENGKKHTIIEKNDCPLNELDAYKEKSKVMYNTYCSYLKRRVTREEKKDKCFRVASLYLKYVPDLVCIDCDSEEVNDPNQLGQILNVPTINNSMCWTRGNNKGFHIYVKVKGFQKSMEGTKVFGEGMPDVDIIKYTKNIWEREDKVFKNKISDFDFSSISHLLKSKKRTIEQTLPENVESTICPIIESKVKANCPLQDKIFTEVLIDKMLDQGYFKIIPPDYDNWVKYGFILVNANVDNLQETWLKVCEQVPDSQESSTKERLEKLSQLQNTPKSKHPVTFRTLLTMLKQLLSEKVYEAMYKLVFYSYKNKCQEQWYDVTKEKFEKDHFEFKGRVMEINSDFTLHQWVQLDVQMANAHLHKNFDGHLVYFLDLWRRDAKKRVVKNIIMRPDLPRELDPIKYPNTYNTFQGYLIEKHGDIRVQLTDEDLSQWKETSYICWVIWHQLCDETPELYEEVMQTFANLLFAPQDIGRYHSCLTFYSDTEGVGKSLITTNLFVNTIIGPNYAIKTSKMDDIFGKYTELAENKILVVIEEGKKSDAIPFADVAKDWLTSETAIVHKKCQSKYITNNCCHLICNTNNKSVWKVSETNRRYLISHCKEELLRKDYLDDVLAEIKNLDEVVKFCRVLYTIFDKNWQCEKYIQNQYKQTEIYKEQLQDQISQIDMFYKQYLIDDTLIKRDCLDKDIKPLDLYTKFRCMISSCGIQDKDIWTNRRFGEQLKKTPGVEQNGYKNYKISWKKIEEYLHEKHLLE